MAGTKEKHQLKATIFIPTYNGEEYLDALLSSVIEQDFPFNYEILVIDSGSTDKTLDIIKKYDEVRLHEIPNTEFGHGKTRNLAAKMAQGEFIVYLSQDAVPASKRWLEFMLEPFSISNRVYCVFGKQTPRPHCDAPTKREVSGVFNSLGPDHSIMIARRNSLLTNRATDQYLTFFSDVNSAVRKDYLLNKIPYRDVKYSEDQLLGKDVLEGGYLKAYAPLGNVWHSNEYSLKDYFYRKFDEYLGMYESLGVLPGGGKITHIKRWAHDTIIDIPFIFRDRDYSAREKIKWFLSSWLRNYYRQKASYITTVPTLREKNEQSLSLEERNKNL